MRGGPCFAVELFDSLIPTVNPVCTPVCVHTDPSAVMFLFLFIRVMQLDRIMLRIFTKLEIATTSGPCDAKQLQSEVGVMILAVYAKSSQWAEFIAFMEQHFPRFLDRPDDGVPKMTLSYSGMGWLSMRTASALQRQERYLRLNDIWVTDSAQ